MGERHVFKSRSSDEAVDSKFCWGTWLEELFEDGAFIRQLGPFAELLWKEELTGLSGHPSMIDQSQFSQLVRRLSGKIDQTSKRQEFLAEVNALGKL